MNAVWTIIVYALRESVRRKMFLVVLLLTLAFRWVACVRDGRSFRGARIVRCQVDFGDPHIVPYCSVLERGWLVTDHDDAAIPCGRVTGS